MKPGARLGVYDVLGLIGSGGMGEVYEARDTTLDRRVALKVLPADVAADPERLARLRREARTVAALNHPNIVTVHAFEEADGASFLVMERIDGRPLAECIPGGGLPLRRILEIAVPIADAIGAAHEHGVVHRDLKPANVMLTRDGHVKVLDFGLARSAPAGIASATATAQPPLTAAHHVTGTLPYMAPEQVRGEPADARSDIFSLGTILYEMASGARPFGGPSSADVLSAILREDPPPLERVRPDLPPSFTRIVARCLEKDPHARLQSAIDLSHELQDLRDSGGDHRIAAPPRRFSRRGGVVAAIAGVITLAAAAIVLAPQPRGPSGRSVPTAIESIAVLPFDNLMRDPGEDYFVDGVHDALITELAKLGTLRVTSRTSVMRYRNSQARLTDIARDLGVDALVEGSVLRSGDSIRINAQLVLGGTDAHVWAERYEGDLANVLGLLDSVSRSIASEIQRATGGAPPAAPAHAAMPPVRPEAYEAYLRARQRWFEGGTFAGAPALRRDYQKVVELDPSFAMGWSGLASANALIAFFDPPAAAQAVPEARAAARKALALDSTAGEAYAALGALALYYDWDVARARGLLERAVALEPHAGMVRHSYADYLMILGRSDDSLREIRQARIDNPTSPFMQMILVSHLIFARRDDEAIEEGRRLLAASPARAELAGAIASALWRRGRYEEAIAEYGVAYGKDARVPARMTEELRTAGPAAALKALADTAAAGGGPSGTSDVTVAGLYAQAGESDAAMRHLERAYANRLPQLLHIVADPAFDLVRSDPRYVAMLRRIGVPPPA